MSDSTNRIMALARHEYRSAVRSKILIVLLGILVAVTAVSVYIASVDYASKLADYQAYVDAAKTSGLDRIAPSPLAALSLLRGAFEYLELIGAVIAPAPTPEEKRVQQQQAKRAAADCTQAKNPSQCKAQQAARKRARQACKDTQGPENKQCIRDFLAAKK